MKRKFWLCTFFYIVIFQLLCSFALAEEKKETGIGLVIGEPSGLNGQFYWSAKSAIDVTVAWSWKDWLFTSVDYQRYDYLMDWPREWKWTYGLGGYVTLPENSDGTVGLRIPLGLQYHFPHSNLAAWGEVAPALEIAPDTQPQFQFGVGLTYWLW